MKRTTVIAAVVAFGLGGLVGALAFFGLPLPDRGGAATTTSHPVWAEVQWPFPMDEWGKGKAFRCTAADCGAEINLYIRAKIGFCNCTTGVSDDDELNRLSDFNLMGDKLSVLGAGPPDRCRVDERPQPVLRGRRSFQSRDNQRWRLLSTITATPSSPRSWSRTIARDDRAQRYRVPQQQDHPGLG